MLYATNTEALTQIPLETTYKLIQVSAS